MNKGNIKKMYFKDTSFANLMMGRIYNILLIASKYDAFMLEEDGRIDELIFNEYTILNGTPDLMKILLQLAQKGPMVGIHLIISTAYPSVNVISNKIKMLFPTRIAFKTRSKADSRTLLDMPGAEELNAFYDMLLLYDAELYKLEAIFSRNIVF